jgi:membrane protease YdiL (CAAX protease family)
MNPTPLSLLLVAPFAYLLICACASALLAYPLHFITGDLLSFHTLVNRGASLLLALGLFPLGRWMGIKRSDLGLAAAQGQFFRQLCRGFGFGALMMGMHVILLLSLEARVVRESGLDATRIVRLAFKGLLIGVAVASIEEPVFRGFLFGSLSRKTTRTKAVVISSLYFAALHFVTTDIRPEAGEVRWNTGLIMVLDAFQHVFRAPSDSFLALFSAGAFLACVRLLAPASGLGYCIGLHAGWVFIIKTAKPLTKRAAEAHFPALVSKFDGIIGHLSTAWISVMIMLLIVGIWLKTKEDSSAAP